MTVDDKNHSLPRTFRVMVSAIVGTVVGIALLAVGMGLIGALAVATVASSITLLIARAAEQEPKDIRLLSQASMSLNRVTFLPRVGLFLLTILALAAIDTSIFAKVLGFVEYLLRAMTQLFR